MKNILVVNVNWLGDVIFSAPVFRALKAAYPQAKISCLAVPRVKEILESIPDVDEIITYDEDGIHRSFFGKLRLIALLRQKKFDEAFLLHRSMTRALLVFLAGIPSRTGYDTKGRGVFLTRKVPKGLVSHRSDEYFQIIEFQGVVVFDRRCLLRVSTEKEEEAELILKKKGIDGEQFILINPGGNWDLKRWPPENFTKLIECLMTETSEKIVVIGASSDRELARSIIAPLVKKPVVLTGETDLKQLLALMKKARVVISADSGPLHLASGVGTRTIGLFGPTRPETTGCRGSGVSLVLQQDVGCNRSACYHLACKDNICMQAVTVKDVFDAYRQI